MPRYRGSLKLAWDIPFIPARRWTTSFFIEAASPIIAAATLRAMWEEHLRDAARERVYCYEVYASDLVPLTDNYATLSLPPGVQRGTIPVAGLGEAYLPKTCVAVNLDVVGSRPSRKFWRPGLFEFDIVNGISLLPSLVSAIDAAFSGVLQAYGSEVVDPDGQEFIGVGRLRLTTREFGRESTADVPVPPPLG